MRAIQETQDLADNRPQRSLVEPDRNRLALHRMEDPESAVTDRGRFRGISRKLPLERPIRLPPASNVLLEIRTPVYQFRIGIFQSTMAVRIIQRRTLGKHIADCGVDRTCEEAVRFMETCDDFRRHTSHEGKRSGCLGTLQLYPAPRRQAEIVIAGQLFPNSHDR